MSDHGSHQHNPKIGIEFFFKKIIQPGTPFINLIAETTEEIIPTCVYVYMYNYSHMLRKQLWTYFHRLVRNASFGVRPGKTQQCTEATLGQTGPVRNHPPILTAHPYLLCHGNCNVLSGRSSLSNSTSVE